MHDRQQRASYLAAVESGRPFPGLGARDGGRREGVGTEGGTQDQAAILLASPGQLLHLSYRPLQVLDQAPLPEGWVVAVGSSGVVARKAGEVREAFNQLSSAVQEAWRQWIEVHGRGSEGIEQAVPHLGAIAARYPSLATDLGLIDWAEERLRPRIRQFATETLIRVPEAMRCMKDGDGEGAAAWIQASHEDAAAVLQHGVPETEALVELARLHGALAASAFGAGFGGSVWALVPPAEAGGFLKRWHAAYVAAYPAHEGGCTFFVSPPGPGAYAGEGPSGSEGP
jgi:galactokinase